MRHTRREEEEKIKCYSKSLTRKWENQVGKWQTVGKICELFCIEFSVKENQRWTGAVRWNQWWDHKTKQTIEYTLSPRLIKGGLGNIH